MSGLNAIKKRVSLGCEYQSLKRRKDRKETSLAPSTTMVKTFPLSTPQTLPQKCLALNSARWIFQQKFHAIKSISQEDLHHARTILMLLAPIFSQHQDSKWIKRFPPTTPYRKLLPINANGKQTGAGLGQKKKLDADPPGAARCSTGKTSSGRQRPHPPAKTVPLLRSGGEALSPLFPFFPLSAPSLFLEAENGLQHTAAATTDNPPRKARR